MWLDVVDLSEQDIFDFWDNVHVLKCYPMKVPQNCFNSSNYLNQTCIQGSKFLFSLGKSKRVI